MRHKGKKEEIEDILERSSRIGNKKKKEWTWPEYHTLQKSLKYKTVQYGLGGWSSVLREELLAQGRNTSGFCVFLNHYQGSLHGE